MSCKAANSYTMKVLFLISFLLCWTSIARNILGLMQKPMAIWSSYETYLYRFICIILYAITVYSLWNQCLADCVGLTCTASTPLHVVIQCSASIRKKCEMILLIFCKKWTLLYVVFYLEYIRRYGTYCWESVCDIHHDAWIWWLVM